jgi:hypothetical protein
MTFQEFKETLKNSFPPDDMHQLLIALWLDAKGKWNQAHQIVQSIPTQEGSWVHAYLHREEGDLGNASYWYSKAEKSMPNISLNTEWEGIVKYLLK